MMKTPCRLSTGSAASRNRFSTGGARHSLEQKGDGTASSIVVEAMMLLPPTVNARVARVNRDV